MMIEGLPKRLKISRIDLGYSQEEVANFLGVTPNTISQYETGATTPPVQKIGKLAQYLQVTTDYLLGVDTRKPVYFDGLTEEQTSAIRVIAELLKKNNS